MPDWLVLVLACVAAGALIFLFAVFYEALFYWLQARLAGVGIPIRALHENRSTSGTGARGLKTLVISTIRADKAGLGVTFEDLCAHAHAGGNVALVVSALIGARHHGFAMEFADACRLDLEGANPLEMVERHAASAEQAPDG